MHAIIPARLGSKRVKKKNLALVGNHPLLAYSIAACQLSEKIDRIIVSTESEEIAEIALKYGAEIPFLRNEEDAQDNSTDFGFLSQVFDYISCEHLALIRPTSPLRDPLYMDHVIKKFENNIRKISGLTGLRTMCEASHSPYKLFKIDSSSVCTGFFKDFKGISDYTSLPNQVFPKAYLPNGYIDIVYRSTIENKKIFGENIYAQLSDHIVDIDNQIDLDIVNGLVGTKYDLLSVHLDNL